MTEEQKPVLTIEKIYVKDLSVEVPHAPGIFLERDAPEVHLELNAKNQEVGDELYEVILTATLTAKLKEQVMFLVEVQQAGVFRIRHVSQENMGPVLAIGWIAQALVLALLLTRQSIRFTFSAKTSHFILIL